MSNHCGVLYGTDSGGGNLLTIDTVTGVGTIVGNMGIFPAPGLAVDPNTGIMYASQGGGAPFIYTVDPNTGNATFLGNSGLGFAAVSRMDFSSDGTLFAAVNIAGGAGTGSDHLAIIDKNTGAATVVGPFGSCTGVTIPSNGEGSCTIEGLEGIAFDQSGTLWGVLRSTNSTGLPGLYTINTSTGAATFVRPIVDANGNPPPGGGVISIVFACDGTLYGGTARSGPGTGDGGRLITIDPTTGIFEFVGTISATPNGQSMGGLAFVAQAPTRGIKLF